MKFKFKKSTASISLLVAAVMVILALIFTIISDSRGRAAQAVGTTNNAYPISAYGMVVSFCVISFLCIVAAYLMDAMLEGRLFTIVADALRIVAGALLVACFSVVVSSRGDLMGYVWFSSYEGENPQAISALNMALVAWIFYVLGIVALAVSIGGDLCVKTTKEGAQGAA